MDRALKILAALFATAAVVLLAFILLAVVQHVLPDFAKLEADPKQAALTGLFLGCGVMFALIYGLAARLIWQKKRWNMAVLLAVAACFGFPIGTVLGIAALVLLTRPAVRRQFS